eukprot:TRINITY_DN4926_c0_g1_i1.p3 TRINITY_DN4926_c0_g1~~TRINITY_DN4926_c0_g1_i1.p3  ORF type:complete len:50 (-),score=6.27 TRINITY_DN4926_c0_g1_i1:197-346(-)
MRLKTMDSYQNFLLKSWYMEFQFFTTVIIVCMKFKAGNCHRCDEVLHSS